MSKEKRVRGITAKLLFLVAVLVVMGTFSNTSVSAKEKYPYLIKVNKRMNTVTVYKKDSSGKYTVPIKAMVCSGGSATPTGTFRTQNKYRWKILAHDVWGQYSTRITGSILFHSVYYYQKDPSTLAVAQYNKLGRTASMGCVRLTTVDAKWIYDNCAIGTTVVIYNSNDPGPLGKPTAIKLPGNYKWDPTDTFSSNNPYNKMKPKITGAKDKTVDYLATVDLKKGVKAYNTTGYNVTSKLKVSGKVNTSKPGKYKVTYSITDEIGRTATKTVTYTVKGNKNKPKIKGVSTRIYSYKEYKGKKLSTYVMDGVSAYVGNQKLSSKYLKYKAKVVEDSESIKKYKVTYTATNPLNKSKSTKSCYIVLDKVAPAIEADTHLYITKKAFTDLKAELKQGIYSKITISDNYSKTSKLSVSYVLKKKNSTYYTLKYTVKDQANNSSNKTVKIYLLTSPKLETEQDTVEITDSSVLTDSYIRSLVKFTARNKNYTSKFKDQITYTMTPAEDNKTFTVVYSLVLNQYTTVTKTITFVVKDSNEVVPEATVEPSIVPTE